MQNQQVYFFWKKNIDCILLNLSNLFSRGTYSIIHLAHHSAQLKPSGLMLCLPKGFKVYFECWTINYSCPNNYLCVWLPRWCKQKSTGWCWQLFDDGCKASVHISLTMGIGSTCTFCWYSTFSGGKKRKKESRAWSACRRDCNKGWVRPLCKSASLLVFWLVNFGMCDCQYC